MVEVILRRIRIWFIVTTVLSELLKEGASVFDRVDGQCHIICCWWRWWWWKRDIVERQERGHSCTDSAYFLARSPGGGAQSVPVAGLCSGSGGVYLARELCLCERLSHLALGKSKRTCANYAQVKRSPNRTQVLPV